MKKKICSLIVVLSLFLSYGPAAVFATGYPVFDVSGWLATIDQLYQAYDMVNNTITQIENQYNMIQQNIERAKSIDWDNVQFDGDFDIRNDIKDATKRVNKLLTSSRNIKQAMTTPSINCGNVKYSIADLCGATTSDMWEGRKNMFTAISDYKYYMTSTMKSAVDDVVDGLDEKQKKAIWTKYGISPSNYAFIQHAHTGVLNAASNILANVAEEVVADKYEEAFLRTSNIIKACTQTVDSNGNITEASLGESMMYMFSDMSGHLAEVEQAIYNAASLSASKAIADDAKKVAEADESAERAEIQSRKNNKVSSRFKKE